MKTVGRSWRLLIIIIIVVVVVVFGKKVDIYASAWTRRNSLVFSYLNSMRVVEWPQNERQEFLGETAGPQETRYFWTMSYMFISC